MRDKIKQVIIEAYENKEMQSEDVVDEFIDVVIDKASEFIFEELKKELKSEFVDGTLKHDFIISPDYYLDLKIKAIKERVSKPIESVISPQKNETQ